MSEKAHPISFTCASFSKVIAGTKTQTRRPLTKQPPAGAVLVDGCCGPDLGLPVAAEFMRRSTHPWYASPRYQPGDLLYWGNEPVAFTRLWQLEGDDPHAILRSKYDGALRRVVIPKRCKRPSVGGWRGCVLPVEWAHPWRGRVLAVRCERVQKISNADCRAEGVSEAEPLNNYGAGSVLRDAYALAWEKLHGAGAWRHNSFVWAYTFQTVKGEHDGTQ